MGGGVVWDEVGVSTGEQLSERGVSRDARGAVLHVVSMVARVLSCGSRFTFGVRRGATCRVAGFHDSYRKSSQEWTDTVQGLGCRMKPREGFEAGRQRPQSSSLQG